MYNHTRNLAIKKSRGVLRKAVRLRYAFIRENSRCSGSTRAGCILLWLLICSHTKFLKNPFPDYEFQSAHP